MAMRSFAVLGLVTALATAALLMPSCDAHLTPGCVGGECGGGGLSTGGSGGSGGSAGSGGAGGAPVCHPVMPFADDVDKVGIYPCDVQKVVQDKCLLCHADPPVSGAPFPLVTYDNSHKEYFMGKPIWKQMCCVVDKGCKDCSLKMPFGSAPQLTGAELQTLLAWCDGGAESAPMGTTCP